MMGGPCWVHDFKASSLVVPSFSEQGSVLIVQSIQPVLLKDQRASILGVKPSYGKDKLSPFLFMYKPLFFKD